MSDIYYEDYSEKSIVVLGETKPHKDALKSMGGRFNGRLRDGKVGWIFSKKSEEAVKDYVENGKVTVKVTKKKETSNPYIQENVFLHLKKMIDISSGFSSDLKKLDEKVDKLSQKLDMVMELIQTIVIGVTKKKSEDKDEEYYGNNDEPKLLRRRPYRGPFDD